MAKMDILSKLCVKNDTKMVLVIADGIGGIPFDDRGLTELEAANSPNLDALAAESSCGLMDPVGTGITPGSGPAHLALFGYDPFEHEIGRGILAALGVGFHLKPSDVAARVNFASIDSNGIITDRRAGRIPTEECIRLCKKLSGIKIEGADIFIHPVKEHRAAVIFRASNLHGGVTDSDPQKVGKQPKSIEALDASAKPTAEMLNTYLAMAKEILKDEEKANMILLRGVDKYEKLPSMNDLYSIKTAGIANYPMYKGVSRLVGMEVLETGDTIESEIETLKANFKDYDYFYIHIKKTDSYGEDGNAKGKIKVIEELDGLIPKIRELNPDVLVVTGDHATPSFLKNHSWHPNPILLWSRYLRPDPVTSFGEKECIRGALGRIPSKYIMGLMLANALRLNKYGA